MITATLTRKDLEKVKDIYEAYQQIEDDMKITCSALNFIRRIKQSWRLMFASVGPVFNAEISHDEQLIKDFESALEAYKKRCEDKLSSLTLTLGEGNVD